MKRRKRSSRRMKRSMGEEEGARGGRLQRRVRAEGFFPSRPLRFCFDTLPSEQSLFLACLL